MPTFDELYKYHSFSKAPATQGLTTGQSINKAGHTVTAKDVWADEIPYMFTASTKQGLDSKTGIKINDLGYTGIDKKYYRYEESGWVDITNTIQSEFLYNSKGKAVLQFHKRTTY